MGYKNCHSFRNFDDYNWSNINTSFLSGYKCKINKFINRFLLENLSASDKRIAETYVSNKLAISK